MDLSRRRCLFYRVHLIGAKGEGGGCGIQWISTSPATLPKLYADSPDRVASAWEAALAADRPVVVEFKTDPEVPPLPPHITLQAGQIVRCDPLEGRPRRKRRHRRHRAPGPVIDPTGGLGQEVMLYEAPIEHITAAAYEIPSGGSTNVRLRI